MENSNDNKSEIKTFHINLTGNPNSCLVKILGHKYRTLVDTGAEVSLMHRRVYDSLKIKPKLKRHNVHLQSAGGDSLEIDGCINITLKIGGTEMSQMFYVVRNLNRNLILGTDWLIQNGVRIYFDLGNDNFMSSDDAMSVNEMKLSKNLITVKLKRKQKKVNKGGSDLKMKRFFKALSDLF